MRFFLLLFFLFLIPGSAWPEAPAPAPSREEQTYLKLQALSNERLNICTPYSDDSLIILARKVESLSRESGDVARRFKAGQILTNTYGLAGNFGLAANKAQQLLDEALKTHDHLAIGLALQSIGDTYMHSDRLALADSLFNEAAPNIMRHGDTFMQLQLLFQRLHVDIERRDTLSSRKAIQQIRTLLRNSPDIQSITTYAFLIDGYEALYAINTKNLPLAEQLRMQLRHKKPQDGLFDIWVYYIASHYYIATGDYNKALAYSDSTLIRARRDSNSNVLSGVMLEKAVLLEKIGQDKEACDLYRSVEQITDSLYQLRYTSQIDSLHVTYWTDQLQMANITRRNELYTKFIGGLMAIVLIAIVIGAYIRRKNRQLKESRQKLESLREATADSIRTKSLFLSNMSHELRTPLNAIVGFSTILTEDPDTDEETRQQCSSYIRQNGNLLLKLINDVVDFSKLQDKSLRFTAAPCEVVELCRNVLMTVQNVKRTQAEMHFETDLTELVIQTDASRLQQVLINLLVNATKFTSEGSITLSLHEDKQRNEVLFAVEDTGCGIPLEKQPRIFERFEKLHEGIQGAGLGLSICKLIVEYTGGRIWIDSAYTRGARFVFTHPLHFAPKQTKARP